MIGPLRVFALLVCATLLTMRPSFAGDENEKPAAKEQIIKGELTNKDPRDAILKKSPHKVHPFKMAAGKAYIIDLESDDFDCVLRLENSEGKMLAINDDRGPKDLNSRIIFVPQKAGEYKIIATCLDGMPGKYSLIIRPGATPKEVLSAKDKLTNDDPRDKFFKKSPAKFHNIKMIAGKSYVIDLKSTDFDSFLRLEDSKGNTVARDDDSGGDLNARITFLATKEGTYRIVATSLDSKTGDYTLTVVQY